MKDKIQEKINKVKERIQAEEEKASKDNFHCGVRRGMEIALKVFESGKRHLVATNLY